MPHAVRPKSAAARAPVPVAVTADLCLLRRHSTLKDRSGSVPVGSLGPGAHKVLFKPSEHLWQVWGLILNVILPLLPSCWGLLLCPWTWGIFFGGIQHSPVDGCSVASCNFGVLYFLTLCIKGINPLSVM